MAQEDLRTRRIPASLSIWPPTQRTREAVVRRLVETLTTPSSALAKRFGVVSSSDAESVAESVEQASLAAVSAKGEVDSVEEGIEALQIYSKEISERLLGFAKLRKEGENQKAVEGEVKEEERSADANANEEVSV
ncbi:hypothetical protein LUZ60_006406 [Juncus effusus]|nr:hypothetical protein LUZ60_006406 [Juncus effusus]